MPYNVQLTSSFKRSVKKLKRRYPHIQDDIRDGVEVLLHTPQLGVTVSGSGGIRKVRLAIDVQINTWTQIGSILQIEPI